MGIVKSIRGGQNPPGRFLQLDRKTKLWFDAGDQKACEETSRALREGEPTNSGGSVAAELYNSSRVNNTNNTGTGAAAGTTSGTAATAEGVVSSTSVSSPAVVSSSQVNHGFSNATSSSVHHRPQQQRRATTSGLISSSNGGNNVLSGSLAAMPSLQPTPLPPPPSSHHNSHRQSLPESAISASVRALSLGGAATGNVGVSGQTTSIIQPRPLPPPNNNSSNVARGSNKNGAVGRNDNFDELVFRMLRP